MVFEGEVDDGLKQNINITATACSFGRAAALKQFMDGIFQIKVIGIDLVIRDVRSSDPYVMLSLGNQSVRTQFIKNNLNPVWNETLMLSIPDNVPPLVVSVFDKDKFTTDDFMGEAEIDIDSLVAAAKALEICNPTDPSTQIEKVTDGKDKNPVVNNGMITVADGKAKQGIVLKLENVESGEIELEIECVPLTQ
ncbi:probable ADP-ribosylation factor GTPase-activating protein AGD11 [Rutidosis leptorrhynchoides]|uniref:probable ADP-ribosylation factor GTPase-activating protein AGD11 n=1 Tax=Rutidosis leptorrhynchoides TaxID=125765 RepID=UPI003A996627